MRTDGDYISREAFLAEKRKQYCSDCDRRKGMKKGKLVFCYEIGEAPCRACAVDDLLNDVEDFSAADVRPVVRGFNKLKDYPSLFECSVCGWECDDTVPGDTETYNFCPNCGADMREES